MSGITNPAEEYFKDGLWGWDSTAGVWVKLKVTTGTGHQLVDPGSDFEVVQPTPADLAVAGHGWDGAAWRKLPLVWGYSDRYYEDLGGTQENGGTYSAYGTQVPPGEVWVIQSLNIVNITGTRGYVNLYLYAAAVAHVLLFESTPTRYNYVQWLGAVAIKAGDKVRVLMADCLDDDVLYAGVWGYKMLVAE